jgi:outer membrane protein assembly factor BamB
MKNRLRVVVGLIAAVVFLAVPALAKRVPPQYVAPVVYEGVRYEAPHFSNPCAQNGGCVVAYDEQTGAQLWSVKVYCTQYDSHLETDVQDVFITSLAVKDGRLIVTNERALVFAIDLDTRQVSGDVRGCKEPNGNCTYSPSSPSNTDSSLWLILFSAAILARGRRPRVARRVERTQVGSRI